MADTVLSSIQVSKLSPKVNNNIAPLKKLRHLRLVRFNLESPRMAESMRLLGLVAEDLNTQKTIKDFPHED